MNTTLLVQITGNTWQELDLYEDVPISLTIQQSDLSNLTQRRTPYSKTILLPDTDNNAKVLEHYFEVNGLDFNPLNKVNCVVQYRGTDIFQGVLRLNAVVNRGLDRNYEVFILSRITDFVSFFRDLQLQDLDYSDLNHELSYSAITQSWENINDGATGLFDGQILYPMINYGLQYTGDSTGATPTFEYSFTGPYSFTQSGTPVTLQSFKPAIQLKSVVDRVFATTPFEVESEFFDSEYFRAIYMDTFQNAQVGVANQIATGITNQNLFQSFSVDQVFQYAQNSIHYIPFSKNVGPGSDPLNNFASFNPTYFQPSFAGQYSFNIRFNIQQGDAFMLNAETRVVVYVSNDEYDTSTANIAYQSPNIDLFPTRPIFGSGPLPVNLFFTLNLTAGQKVYVRLVDQTSAFVFQTRAYGLTPFNQGGVVDDYIRWDLYNSPAFVDPTISMKLGMPNISCFDFFKSMITMFNLVINEDEQTGKIEIEPYNWYYDDPNREQRDWTNILDQNGEVRIEPLTFDLSKDVVYTYAFTENEYLPKLFFDQNDFVYGRRKYTSSNNIFVGEQRYEIPFGAMPTSGITGAPNFIIPQVFYQNNQQQAPYAVRPHLFFWVGNRHAYTDYLRSTPGYWYLQSGNTSVQWSTYPCVSHLNTLESQFPPIISDLSFQNTFDFFGNDVDIIGQTTEYDLFNTFWKTYIDNLYSYESRRLTGEFFFRPIDVYETKVNDKIWIKDANYTIEKIDNANLVNKTLTKMSLIKEQSPYYRIDPPAPIYILEPNEPYPTPEPAFLSFCFVSTDQDAVCNGTAGLENVLSFSNTNTIENLDKVYYNTGTSFALYPMGTYLRQTTSSTTFVVADIYGRVLEIDC